MAKSTALKVDAAWKLIVRMQAKYLFEKIVSEQELDYNELKHTGMKSTDYDALRSAVYLVRTRYGRLPWP